MGQNLLSVTKVIQIFVDSRVHPLKYLKNQHIYSKLHLVYSIYSYILKNSQTFTNPLHSIKSSFCKVRLFLLDTSLGLQDKKRQSACFGLVWHRRTELSNCLIRKCLHLNSINPLSATNYQSFVVLINSDVSGRQVVISGCNQLKVSNNCNSPSLGRACCCTVALTEEALTTDFHCCFHRPLLFILFYYHLVKAGRQLHFIGSQSRCLSPSLALTAMTHM